jgi:transposase
MANQLKVALVHSILTLRERGWSFRRIARALGVHRQTVSRYIRSHKAADEGADSKPSKPAHGSITDQLIQPADGVMSHEPAHGSSDPKPANPPTGCGPPSQCEPFREVIIAGLEQGLTYQRIWQDLQRDHGFTGGYDCVKRFGRRLKRTQVLPFRRIECAPGEEAQVDFGKGAPVLQPNGRRKRPHVLRVVLSYSRKGYSEVVYHQTAESFIRALENAFWHFGGVPKTLVVDNLKAAVLKADWFDPDLNPKIQAFCAHYDTVVLPTKPRTPRHKGKVERGIAYVQDNALRAMTFTSLSEQNVHLHEWERTVADTRIHGTTHKQVAEAFATIERPALSALPASRFPSFQESQRVVSRDAHVEVDKAFYSVPPEYLGRRVWVRGDSHLVRMFDARMQPIAVHTRSEPGRFRTQPEHVASEKINRIERGTEYLLRKASLIGTDAERWAQSMLRHRGLPGVRVLSGLLSLSQRHPDAVVDRACAIAQTHGAYRLRTIRELIKRQGGVEQEQFEFIHEHPIIRNLSDYGDLVRSAFQETCV